MRSLIKAAAAEIKKRRDNNNKKRFMRPKRHKLVTK